MGTNTLLTHTKVIYFLLSLENCLWLDFYNLRGLVLPL